MSFQFSFQQSLQWRQRFLRDYLFLGDYINRGYEIILLLSKLKIKYTDQINLLRGNHEDPKVNKIFGFADECFIKFTADNVDPNSIFQRMNRVFQYMPLPAVIEDKILCVSFNHQQKLIIFLCQINKLIQSYFQAIIMFKQYNSISFSFIQLVILSISKFDKIITKIILPATSNEEQTWMDLEGPIQRKKGFAKYIIINNEEARLRKRTKIPPMQKNPLLKRQFK